MAKHADYSNSLQPPVLDYVVSNTNTSNTYAQHSITSTSRSVMSLAFDEDSSTSESTKSTDERTLYLNQNLSAIDRPSLINNIFKCQTDICQCGTSDKTLVTGSKYTMDSCLLNTLNSSFKYYGGTCENIHPDTITESITYSFEDPFQNKTGIYQDCKCAPPDSSKPCGKDSVMAQSYNSELIYNVKYTVSDDLGPEPDFEPDSITDSVADSTINTGTDSEEFKRKHRIYFTPDEVVVHNKPDDIWVSYLGNVYDLTPLIEQHKGTREIKPLLAFAGKDISDWFDTNGELRHYIHPITGVRVPYLPHGPIPDIRPHVPTTAWRSTCECVMDTDDRGNIFAPWWRCRKYFMGKLTKCARPIRIVNMLTLDECTLNVCCEDKLSRILERLLIFNSHATSYTFKYDTRVLDMNKTLDENHVYDERETFLLNYLPEDTYVPAIHLYFNDDLQWDLDSSDECND